MVQLNDEADGNRQAAPRRVLSERVRLHAGTRVLLSLGDDDRKTIGDDIRTAEFGWPVGMPLCRSLSSYKGLWEIRSRLSDGRIGRVLFCVHAGRMVLLHGFIKKTQKAPRRDLDIAVARQKGLT